MHWLTNTSAHSVDAARYIDDLRERGYQVELRPSKHNGLQEVWSDYSWRLEWLRFHCKLLFYIALMSKRVFMRIGRVVTDW